MRIKSILAFAALGLVLVGCTTVTNEDAADSQDNSTSQSTDDMPQADTLGDTDTKLNAYDAPPEAADLAELQGKRARITTEEGDIVIEFFAEDAPQTVTNFMFLAGEGFYDGLTFHRRVEGFVLQGGDPAGNGTGGPGYQVPAEINDNKHVRGAVATARLGDAANPTKASSGSQFYIVLDEASFLDGEYTVFGEVVEGMDVVDKLQVSSLMEKVVIEDI